MKLPPSKAARLQSEDPDGEEAATRPGAPTRSSTPLSAGMGLLGPARSSAPRQAQRGPSDDDPETVRADRRAVDQALASLDGDPETVQLSRMPISFINESVMDPETVFDHNVDSAMWQDDQQHHDEVPPGPLPSAVPDRSNPTLAREASRPEVWLPTREPEDPIDPRVSVLVPILVGALGGVVIVAIVMAWFAGSP